MVITCDYLHLNNEINFAKPLKMSGINTVLFINKDAFYITLLNMKTRSPTIGTVYIFI